MEKTGMQLVEEKNISMVALADIQPSSYNPRKHFDEASLPDWQTASVSKGSCSL